MSERFSVALEISGLCTRYASGVAVYARGFLDELLHRPDEIELGLYYKHKLTKRYAHFFKGLPKPTPYVLKSVPPVTDRPITHSINKSFLYNRDSINIATIHDATYFVHGTHVDKTVGRWFKSKVDRSNRKIVRLADQLITGSESAKSDFCQVYGYDPDRMRVIYPGFQSMGEVSTGDEEQAIFKKFEQAPKGYLLFAGRVELTKNVLSMIEAFNASGLGRDLNFVIAGANEPDTPFIKQKAKELGLERSVKFVGYVTTQELTALYRNSRGFVFPTYYEGFGMPILEAMSHGVPVLIGNRGAAPEIAGGNAITVDPLSVDEIRSGMLKLAQSNHDPEALKRHAASFTWSRFVDQVFDLYRELLDRK